jgi:transposase InsO family protein
MIVEVTCLVLCHAKAKLDELNPRPSAAFTSEEYGTFDAVALDAQPQCHQGRDCRKDHLPAKELPLRAPKDLDVPQALSRHRHQAFGSVADPEAPGHESPAGLPALQASQGSLEALRKGAPRPPHPDRREVRHPDLRAQEKEVLPVTAIDDCTRLRILRIYDKCNQKTSIQFLDHVLSKPPFKVEIVQTDIGAEFQGAFHWHVLDKGVGHVYIRPATPRLNGKVELSRRIDNEEFYRLLEGVVIDDSELFNEKLQEWETFYNYDRPHGGLGGQTPTNDCDKRPRPRVKRDRQLHT